MNHRKRGFYQCLIALIIVNGGAIGPLTLTANGTNQGVLSVSSTVGIYVDQDITLAGSGLPTMVVQVQQVQSLTQFTVLYPKLHATGIQEIADVSVYTTAATSTATGTLQQKNKYNHPKYIIQDVYEAEPIVAVRTLPVDNTGAFLGGNVSVTTFSALASSVQGPTINALQATAGSVSIVTTGTMTGTIGPQVSNDGTNWIVAPGVTPASVLNSGSFGVSFTGMGWQFIRASYVAATGSGTGVASVVLKVV